MLVDASLHPATILDCVLRTSIRSAASKGRPFEELINYYVTLLFKTNKKGSLLSLGGWNRFQHFQETLLLEGLTLQHFIT